MLNRDEPFARIYSAISSAIFLKSLIEHTLLENTFGLSQLQYKLNFDEGPLKQGVNLKINSIANQSILECFNSAKSKRFGLDI
jgi:hypothetical protein